MATYKVQRPLDNGWATVLLTSDYEVATRKARRLGRQGKKCRFVKVNDLGEETSYEIGVVRV